MQIIHGMFWIGSGIPTYRNSDKIILNIPIKFRQLLNKKYEKFSEQLLKKRRLLEFTFRIEDETGISTIAIVHPKDHFNRKIGYNIVRGRINKQRKNSYHPVPEYINIEVK